MSCDHRKELSDAYGNFEVDDVIISAEVNGKLLKSTIEEGDKVTKGQEVALIDTMQCALQINQLSAQKASVQSKITGVNAQIASYKQQKENIQVNYNGWLNWLKQERLPFNRKMIWKVN